MIFMAAMTARDIAIESLCGSHTLQKGAKAEYPKKWMFFFDEMCVWGESVVNDLGTNRAGIIIPEELHSQGKKSGWARF
jgi:hypothetical protein